MKFKTGIENDRVSEMAYAVVKVLFIEKCGKKTAFEKSVKIYKKVVDTGFSF